MDSRIEEILKEKVGDEYEEVPLMSRIEILLDRLGSGGGDSSEYAHSLELTIDSQTYVVTAALKNTSGEVLGTVQEIDLPLETMVVSGSYDDTTKKVVLTLKNGNTIDFSVADLVDGLQTEITSTNKLNSDLVDDTNQNNKFVTSAEKEKINNAMTKEVYNAGKQVKTGSKISEIFNDYTNNVVRGEYSHAEGTYTTASGEYSHAEGHSTTASGAGSHVEGYISKAIGDYSHAEGTGTSASGTNSHAEGGGSTASGSSSHAEGGLKTKAIGDYSHAEGATTTARGQAAHAEGATTTASGENSHAEGAYTIAASNHQHVQGKYNIQDSNSKYAFIIGNGTSNNNRSNAFAVDWNGLIYVNNSATGVNVSQLQPIIDSTNKLSADLIDDSNSTNKLVTESEKTAWNGKQDSLTFDNSPTANSNNPVKSGGIYTALSEKQNVINSSNKISADLVDDSNSTNKFATEIETIELIHDETEDKDYFPADKMYILEQCKPFFIITDMGRGVLSRMYTHSATYITIDPTVVEANAYSYINIEMRYDSQAEQTLIHHYGCIINGSTREVMLLEY